MRRCWMLCALLLVLGIKVHCDSKRTQCRVVVFLLLDGATGNQRYLIAASAEQLLFGHRFSSSSLLDEKIYHDDSPEKKAWGSSLRTNKSF